MEAVEVAMVSFFFFPLLLLLKDVKSYCKINEMCSKGTCVSIVGIFEHRLTLDAFISASIISIDAYIDCDLQITSFFY